MTLEVDGQQGLPPFEAQGIFRITQEALNNVVKHAKATEVWLRLKIEANSFTLVVEDNGSGLPANQGDAGQVTSDMKPSPSDPVTRHVSPVTVPGGGDRLASGSGLANLKERLDAIGGDCTVQSGPGQGTRVTMTVRVKTGASPILAIGGGGMSG